MLSITIPNPKLEKGSNAGIKLPKVLGKRKAELPDDNLSRIGKLKLSHTPIILLARLRFPVS
jgi:hypothetical protein